MKQNIQVKPHSGIMETKKIIKILGNNYFEQIKVLIQNGILEPVKGSVIKPIENYKLHDKYHYTEKISKDLITKINSFEILDVSWYAKDRSGKDKFFMKEDNWHQNFYKDFDNLMKLDKFLKLHPLDKLAPVSENERSYQIFQKEKVFEKANGRSLLKHVGLSPEKLNIYQTYEFPTFISLSKATGNTTLFVENEDPTYDLVKASLAGKEDFLTTHISYIGYSGGKALISALTNPLTKKVMPDVFTQKNILYWGDIDGDGLRILFKVQNKIPNLQPWIKAYEKMLKKAFSYDYLANWSKSTKNKFDIESVNRFKAYFSPKYQKLITEIVNQDAYIPQEILTIEDF